jgi:hypothetical protein
MNGWPVVDVQRLANPWRKLVPKRFCGLRSNRGTGLGQDFPSHAATAWLDKIPTIAPRRCRPHRLTKDDAFEGATGAKKRGTGNGPMSRSLVAGRGGDEPQMPSQDCGNTKENGTVHGSATSRGGGHGTRTRNPLRGTSFPMKLLAIRLPSGGIE